MRNFLILMLLFVVCWIEPAHAISFGDILGAIATAAGATVILFFAGPAITISYFSFFLLSAAVTLAIGYVAQALAPSQKLKTDQGYKVAGIAPAADQAIIYGLARVGGVVVYKETTEDDKYLHQVIAIAGHECEGVDAIYLDDDRYETQTATDALGRYTGDKEEEDRIDSKLVKVKIHLGTENQRADRTLVRRSDGKWTSRHRLRGICYIYLRLEFDRDQFPNGEPAISFEVRGKKLYDPRTKRTRYSTNSALVMRDFIHSHYGLDDDSTDDKSFASAANICDELVLDGDDRRGPRSPRYTCNGAFLVGGVVKDTMDDILLSMGGTIWYTQGQWKIKAGHYTPPVYDFDEDDLRSTLQVVTKHSRRDSFNIVRGIYKGPETNFQSTDYPSITSDDYLREDADIASSISLDFLFVNNKYAAQRIAAMVLRRNREQLTLKALFGTAALKIQIGDNVRINNKRLGWEDKEFEVNNWKLKSDKGGALAVEMELREISSDIFDSIFPRFRSQAATFRDNNTNLPSGRFVPKIGLSVSTETRIINEHLVNVITILTTTNRPELIDFVEVRYQHSLRPYERTRDGGPAYFAGTGDPGIFEIIEPQIDRYYHINVRGVNTLGIRGRTTSQRNVRIEGDLTPPANVTGFSYNLVDSGLFFQWDATPDLDLSHYRIRHTKEYIDPRYSDAVTVAHKVARGPATSVVLPAVEGTYMIKAIDKSENQSEAAAMVVLQAGDLVDFSNVETATESPDFAGDHDGTGVARGALANLTAFSADPDQIMLQATYTFSNVIDLGDRHRARAGMDMEIVRHQNGNTFDDLLGYFDSLGGPFDTLGDLSEYDDINVIQQVSVNDGPPTSQTGWSDYKQFTAGDFYARSFRFRVVLHSDRAGVTADIRSLEASVRYES